VTVQSDVELSVRELDEGAIAAWDRFVFESAQATFFHRAGWKRVIERAFGHKAHYLYVQAGGVVQGVLPLVHIKHPLFGNALSSLAFCVYGGPIATSGAARRKLDDAAMALAERLDVDHLEYRSREPAEREGWVQKSDFYYTFRKALDPDVEKNMLAIPRKQRAMVRKGQGFGLKSEIDADTKRLYRVYAESVRNLGTPVFSRRYFALLKEEFCDDCDNLVVTHEGRPVSGVMSFYFRDEVLPYYGGGTADARRFAANDFMYWEVMRRACERGCRLYDFGRSKYGTGAFDFKKFWGFPPQPLSYAYFLRRGKEVPEVNPLNPKYRLFIALWKKLPLPVANALGPHIVRHLG
jgi:FemAB-related protein (PEP-CTERM system-associated)